MTIEDKIRQRILDNIGVTQEEFDAWGHTVYGMDQNIKNKFEEIIKSADKIRLHGDYDVDGITATYIMRKTLMEISGKPVYEHLPARFTEGFGLKPFEIDNLYTEDKTMLDAGKNILIVTVDNGITSYDAIEKAKDYGYTVIVTDHHELGNNKLPNADLCIDPMVEGYNPFDSKYYCGAGVAYKIAEEFIKDKTAVYDLKVFAALATICDVMVLKEDNHTIVRDVLHELREGNIPLPLKLLGIAKDFNFNYISEKDFGFTFGPMFNASSRLYDKGATAVFDFLLSPTQEKATEIVAINEERKAIVKEEVPVILEDMKNDIDMFTSHISVNTDGSKSIGLAVNPDIFKPIVSYGKDLHEGIIGIIAGQVTENYDLPSIILTEDPEHPGNLKGSARSIEGFHIYDFLSEIDKKHPDIFVGFGGHAGAAGLSIHADKLQELKDAVNEKTYERPTKSVKPDPISIKADQIPLVYETEQNYIPFGNGNPDIDVSCYVHLFYDKARWVGAEKKTLVMSKSKYKIMGFGIRDNIPDTQKLTVTGPLELSVFNNRADIMLNVKSVCEYEKVQKKEPEVDNEIDYSE